MKPTKTSPSAKATPQKEQAPAKKVAAPTATGRAKKVAAKTGGRKPKGPSPAETAAPARSAPAVAHPETAVTHLKPLATALGKAREKIHDGVRKFLVKTESELAAIIKFVDSCGKSGSAKELDIIPAPKTVKSLLKQIDKTGRSLDSGKLKDLSRFRDLMKVLQKKLIIS